MSYYEASYLLTRPENPVTYPFSPEPGFDMNPRAAGPSRVGIGMAAELPMPVGAYYGWDDPQAAANGLGTTADTPMPVGTYYGWDDPQAAANGLGCTGGCSGRSVGQTFEDRYRQTSWGIVALVAAGALLAGLVVGYAARGRRMTPNRRSHTPNRRWSRKYKNDLPDSAFLYVDRSKVQHRDARGRSHPLSARKLPIRDRSGRIDLPHLRNAIARVPVTKMPASRKKPLQAKARKILALKTGQRPRTKRRLRRAA